VNLRREAPSLVADLGEGRPVRLLQLLAGGLLAGLVWEVLNFWARCKWIYTVPGFEGGKLFEMPILGFLRLPLLPLRPFATWSLVSPLPQGGAAANAASSRAAVRRVALIAAGALAAIGCGYLFHHVLAGTVRSRRPLLVELAGLDAGAATALERAGI